MVYTMKNRLKNKFYKQKLYVDWLIIVKFNAQQFNFAILCKQNKSYNYSTLKHKEACKKTYIMVRNDTNKNR